MLSRTTSGLLGLFLSFSCALFSLSLRTSSLLIHLVFQFLGPFRTLRPTCFLECCGYLTAQLLTQPAHLTSKFGHLFAKVSPGATVTSTAWTTGSTKVQITAYTQFEICSSITIHKADQVATFERYRLTCDFTPYRGAY